MKGNDEKHLPIATHKFLLASASPVFFNMFTSSENKSPIEIDVKNYESLSLFVKFLYTGKIAINSNNFSDISYLANHYKVEVFKKYLDLFLTSGLTTENALSLFSQHGVGIRFLATHPELLSNSQFFQLSKDRIIDLVSSDAFNLNEIEIFKLALEWGKAQVKKKKTSDGEVDIKDLKSELKDILLHIRFPLMSNIDIAGSVVPSGVLDTQETLNLFTYLGSGGKAELTIPWKVSRREPGK